MSSLGLGRRIKGEKITYLRCFLSLLLWARTGGRDESVKEGDEVLGAKEKYKYFQRSTLSERLGHMTIR